MRIIIAAILAAAVVTPAAAHYAKMSDTVTIKKHRAHSAYAHVPVQHQARTQDVYVDGVYVGSDPDWRVRETLRQENRGQDKL